MRSNNFFLLFVCTALAARASDSIPALRSGRALLLRGATVHTVSGADLAATDVLVRDGKIAALGPKLVAPSGAQVVRMYKFEPCGHSCVPTLVADNTIAMAPPGAGPAPQPVRPTTRADTTARPTPLLLKECPDAVAALGICNQSKPEKP